ncbi:MAG: fibronectin type III domain-containing protein [Candidatus Dormibacteria bacterium]
MRLAKGTPSFAPPALVLRLLVALAVVAASLPAGLALRSEPARADAPVLQSATMPAIESFGGGAWVGSFAYYMGGNSNGIFDNHIYRYDPSTQTVTRMNAQFDHGRAESAVFSDGTYMWIAGGNSLSGTESSIWRYDPVGDKLSNVGTEGQRQEQAAAFDGTYAYFFGGSDQNYTVSNTVYRYRPGDATASVFATLNGSVSGPAVFIYHGGAYVLGGDLGGAGQDGNCDNGVDRVDLSTGVVTTLSDTTPAFCHASNLTVWDGNEALIMGGDVTSGGSGTYDNVIHKVVPSDTSGYHVTFTELPEHLPFSSRNSAAVFNGRSVYLFQDDNQQGNANDNHIARYDPQTAAVTVEPVTLPTARYGTAAAWNGNYDFIIGGYDEYNQDILRYDPTTDTMANTGVALPSGRWGGGTAATNTDVFIFGGHDPNGAVSDILDYNIANNTLSTVGHLPAALWEPAVAFDGANAYIMGGTDGSTVFDTVTQYNTQNGQVTTLPVHLPSGRWGGGAAYMQGSVLFLGGNTSAVSNAGTPQILQWTPGQSSMSILGVQLPSGRWGGGTSSDNLNVYYLGGTDGTNVFSNILRYDPAGNNPNNQMADTGVQLPSGRWGGGTIYTGTSTIMAGGNTAPGSPSGACTNCTNQIIRFTTAPPAPQSPSAASGPGRGQVTVSWSPPTGNGFSAGSLSAYYIYRGTTSGAEQFLTSVPAGTTSYTDGTFGDGATVYYQVSAVTNPGGEGPLSGEFTGVTPVPPSAPRQLAGADSGQSAVALSWLAPLSNGGCALQGYDIFRGTSSGTESWYDFVTSGTSYTDTSASGSSPWFYYVRAFNCTSPTDFSGDGPASNEVSVSPAQAPGAPTLNNVQNAGSGNLQLQWTAPASNGGLPLTGYNIYRTQGSTTTQLGPASPSASSYTDTGLTGGTTYSYTVTAVSAAGESAHSGSVSRMALTVPGQPGAPTAAPGPGANQVSLRWGGASGGGTLVTGYNIYRGLSSGSEGTVPYATSNTNSYTDNGVTPGQTYYYRVAANNSLGTGPQSVEATAPAPVPPSAPQNPGVSATAPGALQVSWSAPASNGGLPLSGYNVYRRFAGSTTLAASVGAAAGSWTDSGLATGQTNSYWVTAVSPQGEGTASATVSGTAEAQPSAPLSPAAVTGPGANQVSLSWSAPPDNGSTIDHYNVYRGTASGAEASVAVATTNGFSYVDNSVSPGNTYYYQVTAVNGLGEGQPSSEVYAAAPQVPVAPPTPTIAVAGSGMLRVVWDPPASNGGLPLTAYRVYRTVGASTTLIATEPTTTFAFTDTGLTGGTTYSYNVTAVNAEGESPLSSPVAAVAETPPAAMNSMGYSNPGLGQADLNWVDPPDNGSPITDHRVYRGTASGSETSVGDVGTALSFSDTGLIPRQTYYYQVSAINAMGVGPRSIEVAVYITDLPGAPAGITAQRTGPDRITLNWSPPADDGGATVSAYIIERSTASGQEVVYNSTGATSFVDSSVAGGTTYFYRVYAINQNGDGPLSAEASALDVGLPGPPVNLTWTVGIVGFTQLNWQAPSSTGGEALTGYSVYNGARLVGTVAPGTTSFQDRTCSLGQVCTFTVTDSNGYYTSRPSNAVNALGQAGPAGLTPVAVKPKPHSPL